MSTLTLPHNEEAERAIIGMLLVGTTAGEYLFDALAPSDFFTPTWAASFEALGELRKTGRKATPVVLRDFLRTKDFERDCLGADLTSALADAPTSAHAPEYAEIVKRDACARKAMCVANQAVHELGTGQPPADIIDCLVADLEQIDRPLLKGTADDISFQDLRSLPIEQRSPWVVPGLLRQDWRCLIVGREGDGKSILLRQIAVASALGMHPFTGHAIEAPRVLIVDLENPQDEVRRWVENISAVCERRGFSGDGHLWHRVGGMDLRSRVSRAELEAVLRLRNPDLVVLGPLYKSYTTRSTENDEQVASEVQHVLDDLRTRYGFALLLETHAPHGFEGTRSLRPFGSSLWLRWPEIGVRLSPFDWNQVPAKILTLGRFRGDRSENAWPGGLHRGTAQDLPWMADYAIMAGQEIDQLTGEIR